MTKITYRKLAADDSKHYREIRLESLKAHPESFGSGYEQQRNLPKLMFEKALEEPVDERFVVGAFDGRELIGIFGFIPFGMDNRQGFRNAGELIQLYVKPAYRGRQIGLGLTNAVVHEAFKLPEIDQLVLGVMEGNWSAIRVYEQAGFRMVDAEGTESEGENDCAHIMVIGREN
jgi:ribosomal protein S18 acetylase RimI-like enzyme